MLELILKAIGLGLLLSIFVGPVFFLLLEASTRFGAKEACQVVAGALLSDVIYILLTYIFIDKLLSFELHEHILKIAGGIIFLIIGIIYFVKKPEVKTRDEKHSPNFFLKSFLINSLNPSVFFFWFGAISYGITSFTFLSPFYVLLYFLIALLITLLVDGLKIYFALYIAKIINPRLLVRINKVIGLALFIVGFNLIIQNINQL